MNWIIAHPWILGLIGFPALLAALPGLVRKLEVNALHKLISQGEDDADHELIRDIVAALVKWAEAKYASGTGPVKFAAVDSLLARALPFMSAEDRKKLIEDVVKALDEGAHDATQPSQPQQ